MCILYPQNAKRNIQRKPISFQKIKPKFNFFQNVSAKNTTNIKYKFTDSIDRMCENVEHTYTLTNSYKCFHQNVSMLQCFYTRMGLVIGFLGWSLARHKIPTKTLLRHIYERWTFIDFLVLYDDVQWFRKALDTRTKLS